MPEDSPDVEEKQEEEQEEKFEPEVAVEDMGPCKQRLSIKVVADKVSAEIDKSYKELLDAVDVPGFRKGHVPRGIAERKFGKQINEDAGQKISASAFLEIIEDKKMDTIGEPKFGEVNLEPGKALEFDVTVFLKPKVEFDEYKGIAIHKKSAEVNDKDIDERIALMCKSRAPLAPVERPAEEGDQVVLDFKIISEDKELRSIEDGRLPIQGDTFFGMPVGKDLQQVFEGKKTDDEFEIEVTLPDSFNDEEYRGKPAKIAIKMKEVKTPKLPDIDDEWAKSLGFDDLEDLRDEYETILKSEKKDTAERDLHDQVREYLLEKTDFILPEELIEQQAESVFVRKRMALENQGVPSEEIEKRIDELRSAQQDATRKSFKLFFIVHYIAEKEKIFVTEDEVDARIALIASGRGMPPEEVRTLYEQGEVMDELRKEMREEKTMQFLIDKAEVAEQAAE